MTKKNLTSRLPYLDVLRIVGTVAVVLIHVCSPLVVAFGSIPEHAWWVGHVLDSLSRWAVPVFVMISGAVLLEPGKSDKENPLSTQALVSFFSKRFWRLAVPLLGWSLFYAWYYHVFRNDPLSVTFSLRRMLFDQPYEHLYFLFLLLELAVLTSWLKLLIKELPLSATTFLAGLLLGIASFWTQVRFLPAFFIPYLGYYLAGYVLKKFEVRKHSHLIMITATTIFAAAGIILGTWLAFTGRIHLNDPLVLYEYTKVFVIMLSLGVFALIKKICEAELIAKALHKHSLMLRMLSSVTFGVYLIHPIVIDVLNHGAGISVMAGQQTGLRVVVVLSATLLLSGLLSYGIELLTLRVARFFSGARYELKDPHTQFPYSHKR